MARHVASFLPSFPRRAAAAAAAPGSCLFCAQKAQPPPRAPSPARRPRPSFSAAARARGGRPLRCQRWGAATPINRRSTTFNGGQLSCPRRRRSFSAHCAKRSRRRSARGALHAAARRDIQMRAMPPPRFASAPGAYRRRGEGGHARTGHGAVSEAPAHTRPGAPPRPAVACPSAHARQAWRCAAVCAGMNNNMYSNGTRHAKPAVRLSGSTPHHDR